MSAVPTDISLVAEPGQGRDGALPRNAQIYFAAVAITAASVTLPFIGRLQTTHQWPAFLILASAAAIARLFVVRTPADQAYHTDIVFLIPAALILPPELLVLVAIVQMVPEWLKMRYRWYLQTFNILDYSLSAMAAWFVGRWLILEHAGIANDALRLSLAGLAACVVFVAVNHVLLAVMLRLARGFSLRETGLFDAEYVATDLVLAALGVAVYAFWETNPWLVPFALTPLFLIHRSLSVPALQAEARVDPKTGLFNARHFAAALSEEIGRARRFERPMSLIMADLDLLRDINNTYGHLAGDAVLKGIAEVFRAQLRHYDVPARFGGEEFSILLPETPPDQALEIAERIRRAVAERTFDVETSSEPIRATVSIGVAGFPKDGTDANELIHQADLAVYRAKLQGRNRVLGASSEPLLVPADRATRLIAVPEDGDHHAPLPAAPQVQPLEERREVRHPRPHAVHGPRFLSLDRRLSLIVGLVSAVGVGLGVVGLAFTWTSNDLLGLLTIVGLVGVGQALALEADEGSAVLSVSAVGCLAAASLFGFRAALPLALASVAVEWSATPRAAAQRALQRRRTDARVARRSERVQDRGLLPERHRARARRFRAGPARRRCLLRRQHGPRLARSRPAGPRALVVGLPRALRVAAAALPRLRIHRRRDGTGVRSRPAARARGVRSSAAPHAQDAGGVPQAHAAQRAEAPPGSRDDPVAERVARAGEQAAQGAVHRRDGIAVGDGGRAGLLHRRPFAPRPAARACDRPGARALARRARPARARSALPRHRQARHPRRHPPQAREPDHRTSGR